MSAVHAAIAVAAKNGEEFNPDKVTPGPEGFIATAVFAAAVITLGFLLVKRIRRNSYRHEIRDDIAAELAGAQQPATGAAAGGAAPAAAPVAAEAASDDAAGSTPQGGGSRPDGA
ncbi:hypothetical protein [Leucobacter sp. BZR 635]|uniref:hypothetical protein n=1 Tax=Leucobacter sp. BZR 635 TaxID=3378705 RepID=UPI003A83A457